MNKKRKESKKMVETGKLYTVSEACELVKKINYTKFNSSVDVAIKTFADPKYNDQMVRGTIVLPHGTGKTLKIAAFVSDDLLDEARKAGATLVGNANIIKEIEEGKFNFDVMVTTQAMIKDLAKVAKVLGPKGLMPSPKTGTITNDIVGTIDEIKKGRIEYKLDKTGNVHAGIGKINFEAKQLEDNLNALLNHMEQNKPTAIKGKLMKKIVLSSTMSPGIMITTP
ncbi:MAG TPA: 50S ribosomal protein L1 [Candidatus Absconditabacterales bacterium]|nr:50S ribosomal protein L1 [Candidatus Absconditabacterales bacterium]